MKKRPAFMKIGIAFLAALVAGSAGSAGASTNVPQTALPGSCIPQFTQSLPVFGPAGPIPRVNATQYPQYSVVMKEIDQAVLPQGFSGNCPNPVVGQPDIPFGPFGPTRVWAYEINDTLTARNLAPANWPAVTVEARRYIPVTVTYENQLPAFNAGAGGLVQGIVTADKTVDWADPLNTGCMINPAGGVDCYTPYDGPPPAVPHLHGAEVSSRFDGGPLAWFTPAGAGPGYGITGPQYNSLVPAGPGKAVYAYNNQQEAGTLWFHDHAMGMTRTNVYSGLAAFYFMRDPVNEPKNLPSGRYELELAVQDRQFDTNGQLYFPDGSGADAATSNLNGTPPNPADHPFWIPEFVGDVAIVNGAPWPYFNVEPRRYRLRLLDGSNARFYNLDFKTDEVVPADVPVYAIGSDGNYLNAPAQLASQDVLPVTPGKLFMAPGERYDIIIDFTGLAGKDVIVSNNAPVPFPGGLIPGVGNQAGMDKIMKFSVNQPLRGVDTSCNPATGGCTRPKSMVRLTDGNGNQAAGVTVDKKRRFILKEWASATGPLMVLVNNTLFYGTMSPSIAALFPVDGVSELPRQGATELWEIINLTMDAHPMHTHLTQFQVLNRQDYDTDGTQGSNIPGGYPQAWGDAFLVDPNVPGNYVCGASYSGDPLNPCPSYGPPLPYTTLVNGAVGGNPDIDPFLLTGPSNITAPRPEESGWKDTAKALPGQVLRMLVRFTPTSTAVQFGRSLAGRNFYTFDPKQGPGYVWHCHIVDHEDQDMMRPYTVAP